MQARKWVLLPFIGIFFSAFFNLLIAITGLTVTEMPSAVPEEVQFLALNPFIVVLTEAVIAPLLEELLFRKLFQNALKKKMHYLLAALITSAVFGILHLDVVQGIYAFLFGMLLCEVMEKTGSWLSALVVHVAHNIFSLVLNFSPAMNTFFYDSRIYLVIVSGLAFLSLLFLFERFGKE